MVLFFSTRHYYRLLPSEYWHFPIAATLVNSCNFHPNSGKTCFFDAIFENEELQQKQVGTRLWFEMSCDTPLELNPSLVHRLIYGLTMPLAIGRIENTGGHLTLPLDLPAQLNYIDFPAVFSHHSKALHRLQNERICKN